MAERDEPVARTQTRNRILDAAIATLATQGFSRATARSVAQTGGFTPGVIYYHFDDLDDLFIATAQHTSAERISRYRARTDGVHGAVELLTRLRELYQEDQSSGHVAAVQELVAAAAGAPRLAEVVREQFALWQQLGEDLIHALIDGSPFAGFVPIRELAVAAVGAYLGLQMLSHLNVDRSAPEDLFAAALPLAVMIDTFRGNGA